jgi:hypothetical protein
MSDSREERLLKLSRRELLVGAGGFAAGAAVASTLGGGLANLFPAPALAAEGEAPKYPFPYVKLDPEEARKLGYQSYYEGACSYGAFKAIMSQLREKVGYPYTMIPYEIMRFGEGGAVGWGTLCGALNGAAAAITLCTSKENYGKVINELIGWYTTNPFPSNRLDSIAKIQNQPSNASGSPLCHVSVTEFLKKAGAKVGSPENKDRCGKLTGDVAAKAIELLNALADGTFVAAYKPTESFLGCTSCHSGPKTTLNNALGKQDCAPCHQGVHKK